MRKINIILCLMLSLCFITITPMTTFAGTWEDLGPYKYYGGQSKYCKTTGSNQASLTFSGELTVESYSTIWTLYYKGMSSDGVNSVTVWPIAGITMTIDSRDITVYVEGSRISQVSLNVGKNGVGGTLSNTVDSKSVTFKNTNKTGKWYYATDVSANDIDIYKETHTSSVTVKKGKTIYATLSLRDSYKK